MKNQTKNMDDKVREFNEKVLKAGIDWKKDHLLIKDAKKRMLKNSRLLYVVLNKPSVGTDKNGNDITARLKIDDINELIESLE